MCQHGRMNGLFSGLLGQLQESRSGGPRTARAFRCQCGRPVFFRNSLCIACNTPLGYIPELLELIPLEADTEGTWRACGKPEGQRYKRCANYEQAACNWMLPAEDGATLCA